MAGGVDRLIGEAASRAHPVFVAEGWVYAGVGDDESKVPSEGEIAMHIARMLSAAKAGRGVASSGRIVVRASGADDWEILLGIGEVPMTPEEIAAWDAAEEDSSGG